MPIKKQIKIFPLAVFSVALFLASPVKAICPVCTVAVGAGMGLAQYLGIDDTITGVWIGGLIISLILWTLNWFKRKNINFYCKRTLTFLAYYALVVGPLYWKEFVGHPFNKLWGVDKLILGIILGNILFFSGAALHFYLKRKNGDKVYFPFQKVVFSVSPLIIISAIFYFITR